FDKDAWVASLSEEQRQLLQLEIQHLEISWLTLLHKELTKPYFINLKKFLLQQSKFKKEVFPPENEIYSWSHLTPFPKLRVLVIGQDPYHNNGQAHGLAFLVKPGTRPPPSLQNIYKGMKLNFENFEIPLFNEHNDAGYLVKWASQGVLLLNTCLTVEAHKPNSHSKQGWEQFTSKIIEIIAGEAANPGCVCLLWGGPAQRTFDGIITPKNRQLVQKKHLILKSCHPSPLSANRGGWFENRHFRECNDWLIKKYGKGIDWAIIKSNSVL
ncbi:hypothetical protein BABINDRAFT_29465, partial [Babjeviella inositovora NRRL Y-12698]